MNMIYLCFDKNNDKNIKGVIAEDLEDAMYNLYYDYVRCTYNLEYDDIPDDLKLEIVDSLYNIMSFDEMRDAQLNDRMTMWGNTIDITPDRGVKNYNAVASDIEDMINEYMYNYEEDNDIE